MFWMVYIIQAFALEPYFGPRGELWLGINPPNAYHKTYIPTILVDPQTGGTYFSQLGFNGELVRIPDYEGTETWLMPDCETCNFSIVNKQLLSATDTRGNTFRYSYDTNGNLTHVSLPNSSTIIIDYNSENKVQRIKFGITEQSYQYQFSQDIHRLMVYSAGRLQYTISEEVTTPQTASITENTTQNTDKKIRRVLIENPLGHRTQSFYDEENRLIKFINPLGLVYLFDHQNFDSMHTIKSTLPSGKTYFFEVLGRTISSIEYPNGHSKTFIYDNFGNITSIKNEYGEKKNITYFNNKISSIDSTDGNIYIQHIENGEVFTDSLGFILRVERDEYGRINKLIDPVGGNVTFGYGRNSMTVTNRNGARIDISYDQLDLVSSIKSEDFEFKISRMQNGQLQNFSFLDHNYTLRWNPQNQLTQFSEPNGTSTKFIRNLAGDLTGIQYGSGRESYNYNANGQITSLQDSKKRTSFSYNIDGLLTNTNNWELKYTLNNNIKEIHTKDGSISFDFMKGYLSSYGTDTNKTMIERNASHYPTQVKDQSNQFDYTYNPRGFLISQSRLQNKKEVERISYEYNLCFWPIAYKYKNKLWRMTYDAAGFQLSKGLPNKSKIGYIRDEWGRIEVIRYPSGRMMEIVRSNGQVHEIHKNIDTTPFLETTYTFSVSDVWNSFDMGDGNYFVRRNNLGEVTSIDNGDLLLYARGGPSTYDSKMGMVITDETGKHVGLQTFTGVELWDLPSGYFTYTWQNNRLKEMYSGTEVGKLFYNDLNYLSSYCRDWRCWKFSYNPNGHLLDIYYLEKQYDTIVRADGDLIFRSGLDLLQMDLGVLVSSVHQGQDSDLSSQNREIGYSLRKIPIWYSEDASIRLVDSGFFGYPYNNSLTEWTLYNTPISFPSGPVLEKGKITSPISGNLIQTDPLIIPMNTLSTIQDPIKMIELNTQVEFPSIKGLSFRQPMINSEIESLYNHNDEAGIPLQYGSPLIHLYAQTIIQGLSDPTVEEVLYALLQEDINVMKRDVPIDWIWPWWMNQQKSHYLLAEIPEIE